MTADIRKWSIRLPSPFWFFLATVTLVVVSVALRISVPIYRKQAAIAEFKRLGGGVRTVPGGPPWLRRWIGDKPMEVFDEPVWIYLSGRDVDDRDLVCLEEMPWLVELNLRGTGVTDAGLVHLRTLKKLQILSLGDTAVTDAGMVHLRSLPSLTTLSLLGTNITDAGLKHLEGFLDVDDVYVDGTHVTDVGIVDLALASHRPSDRAFLRVARCVQRKRFSAAAQLAVYELAWGRPSNRSYRMWKWWEYMFERRSDYKEISREFGNALFDEFDSGSLDTRKVIADIFDRPEIDLTISGEEFREIVEGKPNPNE